MVLISGCMEEYDLNLDKISPRLVVEGVITNKSGPYYIRLTESQTGNFIEPDYQNVDNAVAVKNAQIIISDDVNQVDTLIPMDINLAEYTLDRYGYYKLIYNNAGEIIDTLFLKRSCSIHIRQGLL